MAPESPITLSKLFFRTVIISFLIDTSARRAILLLLEALAADTALEGKLALMATAEEWEAQDLA